MKRIVVLTKAEEKLLKDYTNMVETVYMRMEDNDEFVDSFADLAFDILYSVNQSRNKRIDRNLTKQEKDLAREFDAKGWDIKDKFIDDENYGIGEFCFDIYYYFKCYYDDVEDCVIKIEED